MTHSIRYTHWLRLICIMILTGILTECATPNVDNNEQFVTKVKPTLESYCIECHIDRLRSKFG